MICDRHFQGSALREVVGLAQGTAGSEIQGKNPLEKSRNTFPGFWLFFKEYGASLPEGGGGGGGLPCFLMPEG